MKSELRLLQDILDAIASIESYNVQSYNMLQNDPKTRDAVLYNLVLNDRGSQHHRSWLRSNQTFDCMGYSQK